MAGKTTITDNENKPGDKKDKQPENSPRNLLKQKINNFLINYFDYLVLATALIILIAGTFLFIYPKYNQIVKDREAAKENLQAEFDSQKNYLDKIRDLKEQYQLIGVEDRKKIEAMVPADGKTTGLIPEIESIILRNGAILNEIKIEDDSSESQVASGGDLGEKNDLPAGIFEQLPSGVKRLKIEINLSSVSYPVLKNIMKTFENNLRLFDLAKVDYAVDEGEASLIIYTYYLP
jgi:hypothetical protein